VRVNERNDAIAFFGGEEDEKQRLHYELEPVLDIMRRLVSSLTRLTWITAGYGWFTIVAPIIVAAPGFFTGDLTLGGLMMVVGAFNQVQQALRWFVDNFSAIADWGATLQRVASFRRALIEIDTLGDRSGRIELVTSGEDKLRFDDLGIASSAICTRLSERHVTIEPGERVLIIARPGPARSNFFSAIAGLWPWGSGRICLPAGSSMMFMTNRPYLPPGSLRSVLAYPAPTMNFEDGAFEVALAHVGLSRLAPELDVSRRWERELSADEQQALQFARLLLHRPRWILINEALDALDEETRALVLDVFALELAGSAILNIGRPDTQKGFFSRVLHLIDDPHGEKLHPCIARGPAEPRGPTADVKVSTNANLIN
jgi:putative ATP-binding cassette transporter